MTYQFSFELTDDLYLEASKLNYWYSVKSSKAFKIWTVCIGAYLIICLAAFYAFDDHMGFGKFLFVSVVAAAAWLGFTLFFAVLSYLLLPRQSRKLLTQQVLLHGVHHYDVSKEEIVFSSDRGCARLAYGMAHKWAENRNIFLIYHSDKTFQILAKDAMPTAAIDLIRSELIAADRPGQAL